MELQIFGKRSQCFFHHCKLPVQYDNYAKSAYCPSSPLHSNHLSASYYFIIHERPWCIKVSSINSLLHICGLHLYSSHLILSSFHVITGKHAIITLILYAAAHVSESVCGADVETAVIAHADSILWSNNQCLCSESFKWRHDICWMLEFIVNFSSNVHLSERANSVMCWGWCFALMWYYMWSKMHITEGLITRSPISWRMLKCLWIML